jgi:hypothetical protein
MASRCTSLLRLLSKLSVHDEPLLENDAPVGGQIFDRINGEADLFDQLGVSLRVIQIRDCHALPH